MTFIFSRMDLATTVTFLPRTGKKIKEVEYMFVVMVVIDTRNYYYHEEYSGIKHDNYMDAEYELYEARQEGLTAHIKEVE